MTWHGILGHDDIVEQFRRSIERGRLASSFLFAGPPGVGKRTFALKLAQALLCQTHGEETLDPCEHCPSCAQISAGTHPDLTMINKPEGKSDIPVASIIGDLEHRRQEGLCHDISLKPFMGGRKIAVIDDADYLNPAGANALLKTLEEPPPRSVLILIGTSASKQLPTIRSRCQLVRFRPLDNEIVAQLLLTHNFAPSEEEARRLARYSEGSVERARELADPELWTFRNALFQRLSAEIIDSLALAAATAKFVEAAGKEASPRRRRLHQIVGFAADFFRQLLRAQSNAAASDDAELQRFVKEALGRRSTNPEKTAARLDRCLETDQQIDRNANQSTLIEAWLDGLAG